MKGNIEHSEEGVLSRLFDKAFSQYWMLLWNHQSFDKFVPFHSELEEARVIWCPHITPSATEVKDHGHQQAFPQHPEVARNVEVERYRKFQTLEKLQEAFQLLIVGCDVLDVISARDDFDDIHSENLKYVFLPFLAAHVMVEKPDMTNRMHILRRCRVYLSEYVHFMAKLNILRENEATYWERETEGTLGERRSFKVSSASYSIGLKKALCAVFTSSNAIEQFFGRVNANMLQDEDTYRSKLLDIARLFSVEAINTLDMIKSELSMLERRKDVPGYKDNRMELGQEVKTNVHKKPWFVRIDDVSKLDYATAHLLYKSMVFTPGHRLPEISLEECARIEMEMDVNTIGCGKRENNKGNINVSHEVLSSESSDEDSDANSEDTKEKAKWDDWKDDHPKGSGNKNRNVG